LTSMIWGKRVYRDGVDMEKNFRQSVRWLNLPIVSLLWDSKLDTTNYALWTGRLSLGENRRKPLGGTYDEFR